tara:strand:+ start:344 stop:988 length:645 start_codon:yes stop_codon:yes gene_type:complete
MEINKLIIVTFCLLLTTLNRALPINLKEPPPKWEPILAEMLTPGPIKSHFKESRFNRFQKLPRCFEGRLWWDPQIGLSLLYEEPSELIINVLKKGLSMGQPGKPLKSLPSSGQGKLMQLFFNLFNWDVAWLQANFQIEGSISEAAIWQLRLLPLEQNVVSGLSSITLGGEGGLLNTIQLDLRGRRSIGIELSRQERVLALNQMELRLAFPDYDE